jgi:hypothetical protein
MLTLRRFFLRWRFADEAGVDAAGSSISLLET